MFCEAVRIEAFLAEDYHDENTIAVVGQQGVDSELGDDHAEFICNASSINCLAADV